MRAGLPVPSRLLDIATSQYDPTSRDEHFRSQLSPRITLSEARRNAGPHSRPLPSPRPPASRLSTFRKLLETPPPSPALPTCLAGKGSSKKKPVRYLKRLHKVVLWTCGIATVFLYWIARILSGNATLTMEMGLPSQDGRGLMLPAEPAPAVVFDSRGRWGWTVSIPPARTFPLRPSEYANICARTHEVSQKAAALHGKSHSGHYGYYHVDPLYIDVQDAVSRDIFGKHFAQVNPRPAGVCERSLTYVLESQSAGIGQALLGLWQAYGLAKREGRAFFVDDSNWAYGKYSTYFAAPPSPGCRQPPPNEIVPCPHHAKHLVVSAATTAYTFGHNFVEEFEDGHGMGVYRQKEIFGMLYEGYEALFKLNDDDSRSLQQRRTELRETKNEVVGMHIRRGDRHPYEFQYSQSYIPTDRYVRTAQTLLHNTTSSRKDLTLLVASDDPDIYSDAEIEAAGAQRTQYKFLMASKSQKPPKQNPNDRSKLMPFSEPPVGWEGGFFARVFWNIGKKHVSTASSTLAPTSLRKAEERKKDTASRVPKAKEEAKDTGATDKVVTEKEDLPEKPSKEVLQLRSLLARAYLLDLAVLGQSDGVACTISSSGCRILAVMMGWQKAIEEKKWKNIDGDWEWRGIDW